MDPRLIVFFLVAVSWRLWTLVVSRRHEAVLKTAGAREFGARNSAVLAALHTVFYLSTFVEGLSRGARMDALAFWGMILYLLSALALAAVWRELGGLWTVKLLIAPDHTLKRGGIFRSVRHPNYLLNILPELLALVLVYGAWITLLVVLPPYLLSLWTRIREEERVMRAQFAGY